MPAKRSILHTHDSSFLVRYLHESGDVNEVVHEPQQVLSCGRKERKIGNR